MKSLNLIKIAWKALMRNRLRAFLTMLGIIIGVASVIVMLAIGEGSKQSIKSQVSSMGSNMIFVQPGSEVAGGVRQDISESQTLKLKDVEALQEKASHLSEVSPQVNGSVQVIYGANNWPSTIYGIGPEYLDIRMLEMEDGTMFTEREVHTAAKVAVIGQTIVENVFPGVDPIGMTIRVDKIPLKVIGVLKEKGENSFGQDQDDVILSPYTTVMKRFLAVDYLQSIVASAISEESSDLAVEEMTRILRDSHRLNTEDTDDFTIRSQQELLSTMGSISDMLTLLLVAIAGISLLVGGIGIMNIMYVSVTERTREIGLRMAVGGQGSDILLQFLIEAILISFTGGVIGVVSGVSGTLLVSGYLNWPVIISTSSITLSFAVCVVIGVFFGWYPARKAANLDPIVALRFE